MSTNDGTEVDFSDPEVRKSLALLCGAAYTSEATSAGSCLSTLEAGSSCDSQPVPFVPEGHRWKEKLLDDRKCV